MVNRRFGNDAADHIADTQTSPPPPLFPQGRPDKRIP